MNRDIHPNPPAPEHSNTPAFEALLTRALAQAPRMAIPESFAATVARRAAAQPLAQPASLSGWGPRLALFSGALLTLAMFALAPHANPSLTSLPFDAELLLLTELTTLVLFANRLLSQD